MKDPALNGSNPVYVMNVLTEPDQACKSLRIHENIAVWLFWEFMIDPCSIAIKVRLTFSSYNTTKNEGPVMTYVVLRGYLSR